MELKESLSIETEEKQNSPTEPAVEEKSKNTIKMSTLFKESWAFVKEYKHIVFWYVLTLSIMAALAANVTSDAVIDTAFAPLWILAFFVTIIFLIINGWAMMHLVSQESDSILSYKTSFDWAAKNFLPLTWTSITVFVAIMLGYILFIVPGVILSVYLYFALYAHIIDGEVGIKALKQSYRVVKGQWWNTAWKLVILGFYMVLVYIVVTILVAIVVGILGLFGENIFSVLGAEIVLQGILGGVLGVMSMYVLARYYKNLKTLS